MAPLLIDEILVSARVNSKINQVHHLSRDDVEEAVDRRIATSWGTNEEGVSRLLLIGLLGRENRRISVVLYPSQQAGVWRLATAFPGQ